MGARAGLSGLAALLAAGACGKPGGGGEIPLFASELPGRTALVLWGEPASPRADDVQSELAGMLAALAAPLEMRPVGGGDVVAYRCADEIAVGWDSLAASHPFRRAAAAAPVGEQLLYADLELLLESAMRRWAVDIPGAPDRLRDALGLRGLQYLVLAVARRGDELVARGTLGTSGSAVGVPGLLTSALPRATPGPVLAPRSRLQLEAHYDPRVARRTLEALTAPDARGSLFGDPVAGLARAFDRVVEQMAGRASLAVYGLGNAHAAVRVRSESEARAAIDDLIAQIAPAGRLGPKVAVVDGWAVLRLPGSPAWSPPTGETVEGPFVWASAVLPPELDREQRRLTLWLRRAAADEVAVELSLAP